MRLVALVAAVLIGESAGACTYDQSNQLERLSNLANVKNGSLNESALEVTWEGANHEKYAVVYGGCDHLGYSITVRNMLGSTPTEAELFEIAQRLANELWWGGEGKLLHEALAAGHYTRDKTAAGARFDIVGNDYSEMYVQYRAEAGDVVVELGWVRDF